MLKNVETAERRMKMSNYIDTVALMDSLHRVAKSLSDDGASAAAGCVAGTIMYIANFPAADVEQVKRGKWISECDNIQCYYEHTCSICGKKIQGSKPAHWNYCPNCGAKMEEKS